MGRLLVVVGTLTLLASCASEEPETVGTNVQAQEGDAGSCGGAPIPGCSCSTDGATSSCWVDLGSMCGAGQLTCEDGTWSDCVVFDTFAPPDMGASLSDGPTACNPCNPDCSIARDYPGPRDLPGRATPEIVYDPTVDGITLGTDGGGTGSLPDTDGDGTPDVADDYPTDPRRDGVTELGGFFHVLPHLGPSFTDPFDFTTRVTTADVYFLFDTTGSMGGELANLRSGMTSGTYDRSCPAGIGGGIIGATKCIIPNAWFGVGHYDDYPVSPYGSAGSGDVVYRNFQDLTPSESAAQAAVNSLRNHYGADGPESQTQALYAMATGAGLGPFLSTRTGCAVGRWGWPCFRPDTIPIVVQFTDATYHNGPQVAYDYNPAIVRGGGSGTPPVTPPSRYTPVGGNETTGSARFTGDASRSWTGWSGRTCGMRNDYNDIGCNGRYSPDAVFRFSVSRRASIRMDTIGSSYDTVLGLFNSGFGRLACNDDAPGTVQSLINYTLNPSGTYYAVVDGYGYSGWWGSSSSCGNYRFAIGVPPPPPAGGGTYPITWAQCVGALNDRSMKVITVESSGGWGGALPDSQALARLTGSTNSRGSPYVFTISSSGSGLSTAVVDAIADLANNSRFDVSARAEDNPATPGFDERGFVSSIRTRPNASTRARCTGDTGTTFLDCLPGTEVDFAVTFHNDVVPPTAVPQVFDFEIVVLLDGTIQERIPVRIVVPPELPEYPEEGSFFREYDANVRCEIPPQRPDWGTLTWSATTPPGTEIEFQIQTEDTLDDTRTGPIRYSFTVPPTTPPIDLGEMLGTHNLRPYLRLTTILRSNEERTAAPVLNGFELTFVCTDME